ncbi:MAG: ferredoxin--NADP(+) reductase [Gammaproteobacteria bacterium]|jgi:ferredoxin-NADP reductase|nr:ferredoxin--NADP(+) reductase [Gammaproteobacteria bacterium]
MNKETLTLIVDHIREIAPGVRHIGFRRQDGKTLVVKPGQFITLLLPSEGEEVVRRNYSIATIPASSDPEVEIDLIEIALTYVNHGFASERLFSIKTGETLDMMGPSGRLLFFHEHKPPRRLILVATGTGVSPYRAMLPQLARFLTEDNTREIVLLFGIRTPHHVLYHDDFVTFAQQNQRFSFHCCYSREMPSNPSVCDHAGYVQTFLQTFPLEAAEDIVYLCGNPAMVDEAYTHLKACQFSIHTVRREKYLSAR